MIREKETLFTELKDSRYEVAALKEELEKERKHNEEKQMALHKDIRKLAHKLKGTERNQTNKGAFILERKQERHRCQSVALFSVCVFMLQRQSKPQL